METYCDLHIHTCLSPCAQEDMTPWNIVGMARVKGLQMIAITDHNAALNLPQAVLAGREYGVEVVAGMEITTREDVHMLAYFDTVQADLAFGEEILHRLPHVVDHAGMFGEQVVIGDGDLPVGKVQKLLLNPTNLTVDDTVALVQQYGGVCIPAHINRGANGMLGALGLMPPLPAFPAVEVYRRIPCPAYARLGRLVLHASDAHRLEDIAERDFTLPLREPTVEALFAFLREQGCGKG